jgi:AAA+ superfamily predicted ATPase
LDLGTGKSLTAKAIASDWQLPLLKLDVGGGCGRSESRLRQMISVAETISPVFSGLMKSIKLLLILSSKETAVQVTV